MESSISNNIFSFFLLSSTVGIQKSRARDTIPVSLHPFAVQLLSRVRLFATPWTAARQASLSFTMSQSLLKLMSSTHQIRSLLPGGALHCPDLL